MYVEIMRDGVAVRRISVYMPHMGYPSEDFDNVYEQMRSILDDSVRRGLKIYWGDFNTQLRIGFRGDSLAERCYSFDLHIANHEDGPNAWTFCSSLGVEKRLDYIIHNANIVLNENYPTEQLDLGSDHRAVHASFYMETAKQKRKTKKTKPIDLDRYHAALDEHIRRNVLQQFVT